MKYVATASMYVTSAQSSRLLGVEGFQFRGIERLDKGGWIGFGEYESFA